MTSSQSAEKPKRLTPTSQTVRELYLKSGNECAFPGCSERLVDGDGVVVGEICHIEAALPGGERFNPNQTNEERCSFDNLIMLCQPHHTITNDVSKYPVEMLRAMKAEHEAKYVDIIQRIQGSLIDHTSEYTPSLPVSLNRINTVLDWKSSPEELALTAESITKMAQRIGRVPRRARELISILVERGKESWTIHHSNIRALHHDIVEALETDDETVIKFVRILEVHGLAYGEESDRVSEIVLEGPDWPFWTALREFAEKTNTPLSEIIVECRFNLLD